MATEWFHKSGDGERGPMKYADLVDAARAGRIARTDFVRSTWHTEWQPADSVLAEYLSSVEPPQGSQWSETVKAAVAASKARHASREEPQQDSGLTLRNPLRHLGRFLGALVAPVGWMWRRLFGRFEGTFGWLAELWGSPAAWLTVGAPVCFALVAAAAGGLAVEDWSAGDALLRSVQANPIQSVGAPGASPPSGRAGLGRRVPLLGVLSRGEYLFFLIDLILVIAVSAYFSARLLLWERPAIDAVPDGPSKGAVAVRRVLGGRGVALSLLLAIAAILLKDSSVLDASNERIYRDAREAFERVKELSARETNPDEWESLETDVRKRLTPAADRMLKRAGDRSSTDSPSCDYLINDCIRRPLIRIGRYELPALIREARRDALRPNRIKNVERDLDDVRRSLDAMSLAAP